MLRFIILGGLACAVVAGGPALAKAENKRPNPAAMSSNSIRLHNAKLAANDPQFIVCRRYEVTGSLAKKQRVCMTRERWGASADKAREWFVDALNQGRQGCSTPTGAPCE